MLRVAAILLLACGAVYAQDNHYWTHQFGTRSALMGGAVVGGVEDTSAVYYNPARLGWVLNDSLKVSADAYQLSILSIADGAGTDLAVNSIRGDIIRLTASGVFLFRQPRIGLGFQVLARQYFNARASNRVGVGAHPWGAIRLIATILRYASAAMRDGADIPVPCSVWIKCTADKRLKANRTKLH